MSVEKLFRIGDVARMFHLSMSSLRHYENAGLLTPEKVDPETGYRYYGLRQFEVLNTIRYLRALDMPLADISDFLQKRELDKIEEKLRQQKETVARKQRELARIERKIDNRLERLRDARASELDVIRLRTAPACRIVWMRRSLQIHGFLDMEAPIRELEAGQAETSLFLGKVGVSISPAALKAGRFDRYEGVFLTLDAEDNFQGETLSLPETLCAAVRFRGSHTEAPEQYARLMAYIGTHSLSVCGFSREITLIDYGVTDDPNQFVTEISVPVQ